MADWIEIEGDQLKVGTKISRVRAVCTCATDFYFLEGIAAPATASQHDGFLKDEQIIYFNNSVLLHKSDLGTEIPREHKVILFCIY